MRAVILKTTFVHCTTTLTHQQNPHMRSTDWLSHHRLAIYRYKYLGTNMLHHFVTTYYKIYSSEAETPLSPYSIHGCNHLKAAKQKQKIFLDNWKLASCIIWPPQVSDEKWTPAPAPGRSAAAGGLKPGLANNSAGGAVRYLPGYLHSLWRTANYCFIAGWEFAGEGRIAWARCCGCQHTTQG